MKKRKMLYEGKAKKIYETDNKDQLICEFKDDATAFDGKKKDQIKEKGKLNAEISTIFFNLLEEKGIPTHFVKKLNETDILIRRLEIIPVEVVVRNIAAGSLAGRLGLKEGKIMKKTVLEFYFKSDELGDPLINEYHIYAEGLAEEDEINLIKKMAVDINDIMAQFLGKRGIDLVDFKLEFGRDKTGKVLLGDEISPDTCRFWDSKTKEKMDKDRFRQDLGEVISGYQEVLARLQK
ncbi:MAG: phosphoribosylaminoimidazolesuccinocarboxamide synthase [Halanaerobiales bacterium]